jgi:hypothetical protein
VYWQVDSQARQATGVGGAERRPWPWQTTISVKPFTNRPRAARQILQLIASSFSFLLTFLHVPFNNSRRHMIDTPAHCPRCHLLTCATALWPPVWRPGHGAGASGSRQAIAHRPCLENLNSVIVHKAATPSRPSAVLWHQRVIAPAEQLYIRNNSST